MNDDVITLPITPEGVEPSTHLRDLLDRMCAEAAIAIDKLHSITNDDVRDFAAETSTFTRELTAGVRQAIDRKLDDEQLLSELHAHMTHQIENADELFMRSELRDAHPGKPELWELLESQSLELAIGDMAAGSFMGYALNDLRDWALLRSVEHEAPVPLMHALVRAYAAGAAHGLAQPLPGEHRESMLAELLLKVLPMLNPREHAQPLFHQRSASTCECALWNLTRIIERDYMSDAERLAHDLARDRAALEILEDLSLQKTELPVLPDFRASFDTGVALGTMVPLLRQRADDNHIAMSRRAHPVIWTEILR